MPTKTSHIIDVHTHLNNHHEDRVVSIDECLDKLLAVMQKNSIDHSLVLTSCKVTEHRPPARDVIRAIEKHKNMSTVAGISFLNYKQSDLREIAEYLESGLVKALKLYPGYEPFYPYDKRCQLIYDLATEFDVPVMFHTGETYSPKGKLRYGTDWPICNMHSYLNFMRDLKLPKASMDKIMWKNAAELFKIDLGITAEAGEKVPTIWNTEPTALAGGIAITV